MTPCHTSATCIEQSAQRPVVNRESKNIFIVAIALFFVVIKQRPCLLDCQVPFLHGTKQFILSTDNSQMILDFHSVATPSATCSLSTNRQQSPRKILHSTVQYTKVKMDSNINVEDTYRELAISAIGAINLNAESQVQDNSSLSYSRMFHLGKPISDFYCKRCNNGLGHIAPSRCNRCRPFTKNLESVERTVVGFRQIHNGITIGEYFVYAK